MERIKEDVASLFKDVFTEQLEAARREFRVWADKLIEFLNQHYVEAKAEAE